MTSEIFWENIITENSPFDDFWSEQASKNFSNKKEFLKRLDDGKILTGSCNIQNLFSELVHIPGDSIETVQYFARIDPEKIKNHLSNLLKHNSVFLKKSADREFNDQMKKEIMVYRMTSILQALKICPNYIEYIADFECNDLYYLMTKLSIGCMKGPFSMNNYISGVPTNSDNATEGKIIFQILYGLRELNLAGIRHNDCHSGNVLLELVRDGILAFYFLDKDTCVVLKTKYIAKIFDYDQATFTRPSEHDMNDSRTASMCKEYCACPAENPKYDFIPLLSSIYTSAPKRLYPVLEKLIPEKKLLEYDINEFKASWPSRPCRKVKGKEGEYEEYVITDDQVLSFEKMLPHLPGLEIKSPEIVFDEYREIFEPNLQHLDILRIYASQKYRGGFKELTEHMKSYYKK